MNKFTSIFHEQVIYLNEIYIGKTKELLDIEKQLHKAREPYISKKSYFKLSPGLWKDPEIQKLEDMFAQEFGFNNLYFRIINDNTANACTYPADLYCNMDFNKAVSTSGGRYKFIPSSKAVGIIYLNSRIFCSDEYTDGEVMAVILHEIGHNFECAMNNSIYTFTSAINFVRALTIFYGQISNILYVSSDMQYMLIEIKKAIRDSGLGTFLGYLDHFKAFLLTIANEVYGTLNTLSLGSLTAAGVIASYGLSAVRNPVQFIINLIIQLIMKPFGKGKENLSDTFAYIYGYGTETSTLMTKFSTIDTTSAVANAAQQVPILNTIIDINSVPIYLIVSLLDVHPSEPERVSNIIKNAKYDINKDDIDPRLKKQLLDQIEELEDIKDKYYESCEKIPNGKIVRRFMYKILSSKDIRNPFSKPEDIEKLFNKYKEN